MDSGVALALVMALVYCVYIRLRMLKAEERLAKLEQAIFENRLEFLQDTVDMQKNVIRLFDHVKVLNGTVAFLLKVTRELYVNER